MEDLNHLDPVIVTIFAQPWLRHLLLSAAHLSRGHWSMTIPTEKKLLNLRSKWYDTFGRAETVLCFAVKSTLHSGWECRLCTCGRLLKIAWSVLAPSSMPSTRWGPVFGPFLGSQDYWPIHISEFCWFFSRFRDVSMNKKQKNLLP